MIVFMCEHPIASVVMLMVLTDTLVAIVRDVLNFIDKRKKV